MKVAVIGCGTIANAAHIPSYMNNPEAEIKYFCDIIPERAQAAVESTAAAPLLWIITMSWQTRKLKLFPSAPRTMFTRPFPLTHCAQARMFCARSRLQELTKKPLRCRRFSTRPARCSISALLTASMTALTSSKVYRRRQARRDLPCTCQLPCTPFHSGPRRRVHHKGDCRWRCSD